MTTEAEILATLTAVKGQLDAQTARLEKVVLEITGLQDKITELTDAAAGQPGISPALEAAVASVATSVGALVAQVALADDQVPDAV